MALAGQRGGRGIATADLLAVGGIALVLLLLGAYCVQLSQLLYLNYGPFWDSVSYDNLLARIMLAIRSGRPFDAVALLYSSTVVLPWLQAMLVALFAEPSRAVATWLQIFWVLVTALTAYGYFRRIAGYGAVAAAGSALLFFAIARSFAVNGGLADFRLDYLQYTLFGLSCLVYLIAVADGRPGFWFLWGLAVGVACLARATTPVYVVLVFFPLLLVDLWQQRRAASAVLARYALAALACIASCGWYFATNFEHLYFYYVVLNWDAHAGRSLGESLQHLTFLFGHIGSAAALTCMVLLGMGLAAGGRWNLRALWCGLAPLGFLILNGTGPNDEVSLIAVFGILLFALAPRRAAAPPARLRTIAIVVGLTISLGAGAWQGYRAHTEPVGFYSADTLPPRAMLDTVTRCMTEDIEHGPPGRRTYALLYMGVLNSEMLVNTLLFDGHYPGALDGNGLLAVAIGPSMLTPTPHRIDKLVTPAHWALIPGQDDAEKIASVARMVADEADYIIIPDRDLGLTRAAIDQFSVEIGATLADQATLLPLCTNIATGPNEAVSIYRNESRRRGDTP